MKIINKVNKWKFKVYYINWRIKINNIKDYWNKKRRLILYKDNIKIKNNEWMNDNYIVYILYMEDLL